MEGFPGIEDKDNWHGKALGDKADEVIKAIKQRLHSQQVTLKPKPPTTTVNPVDLSKVYLSEPPNYNLGDKVFSS